MKEKYITWFRNLKIDWFKNLKIDEFKIKELRIEEFKNIDLSCLKNFFKNKTIKSKELRVICSQISILLDSGASIDNILESIGNQQNKKYKDKFLLIVRYIKKGSSIESSFRRSDLFGEFFYNMIKCGENSGKLSFVMKDMADYYDRDYKVKSKIKSMMIYPLILLIMMLVALIFIIYAVIPNFALVFESNKITPPLFSYIVIKTMLFLREYMSILIPIFIIMILLTYTVIKGNEQNTEKIDELKCKFPIIKNFYLMSTISGFSRNMYIMIKSGVPLVEAISIASDISDNKFIKKKLDISMRYISKGNSISKSIELSGVFPDIFVSMLKNGEVSGNIENSFRYINDYFENELDIMTDKIMKLIEPIMTIVMGLVIGSIIIAIVMPMFDAITAI